MYRKYSQKSVKFVTNIYWMVVRLTDYQVDFMGKYVFILQLSSIIFQQVAVLYKKQLLQ